MAALKADNAWPAVPKTDLVVGAAEGCFARAVAFARAKRSEGVRVVLSYQTDKSKVLAQAENEGRTSGLFGRKQGGRAMKQRKVALAKGRLADKAIGSF